MMIIFAKKKFSSGGNIPNPLNSKKISLWKRWIFSFYKSAFILKTQ